MESIQLPSGLAVRRKTLTGRQFFKFQAMAAKNTADAGEWFILNAFEWEDGTPIVTDDLDESGSLGFDDVLFLNQISTQTFTTSRPPEI